MSDRFDNEESTGFVSNIPQEVVDAIPYGPGMMIKAIFQKVWDYLNRDPKLQKEFAHALELWKMYRTPSPAQASKLDIERQEDREYVRQLRQHVGLEQKDG